MHFLHYIFDKPVPVSAMSSINFVLLFWFQFVRHFSAAVESNFFWDVLICIEIMTVKRLLTEVLITDSRMQSGKKSVAHTGSISGLLKYQANSGYDSSAVTAHLPRCSVQLLFNCGKNAARHFQPHTFFTSSLSCG